MKLSAFFACFAISGALLLIPSTARADGSVGGEDRPVRLVTGFGVMSSRDDDVTVTRSRFTLSPEFSCGSRLTLAPFVRLNSTSLALREKNGMPFDLDLNLPWQPTLGGRADFRAADIGPVRLTLRAEFESPLAQNQAHIASYSPKRELAQAPIDADTLRNHVVVNHLWRSASGSLVVSAQFGRFRPYVEGGYIVIDSSLAVTFDKQAGALLDAVKVHPDRFYSDGTKSFFYTAGTHIDLGRGFSLRLGGAFIPNGQKHYIAGEGALVIPVNIPGL